MILSHLLLFTNNPLLTPPTEHSRGTVLVMVLHTIVPVASICTTANRMIQSHTSLIKKGNIKRDQQTGSILKPSPSVDCVPFILDDTFFQYHERGSNRRSRLPSEDICCKTLLLHPIPSLF